MLNGNLVTFYISGFEACFRFRLRRLLAQTCCEHSEEYLDEYSCVHKCTEFSRCMDAIHESADTNLVYPLRTVPLVYEIMIENIGYHNVIKISV